jgi:integrase
MFGWGVSEELVPVAVWRALKTTPHLRPGESRARETEKRQPVADDQFEAVLPFLPPVVADLLRFARLVSCRPDEASRLRMADVEPAGAVFKWTLRKHKTAGTVGAKAIPIGPRAAAVMQRWAAGKGPGDLVFSRADRDRVQVEGTIRLRPLRSKQQQFDTDQITKWIHAACDLAKTPHWTTYQLRHAGLTAVRRECGVEAEAAIAGWTTPKLAYHYAQLAFEEGAVAAAKLG